jgi:hypothetical protein
MAEIYKPKNQVQNYDAMKRWLVSSGSKLNNFNEGARLAVLLEAVSTIASETGLDFYTALKAAIPTAVYNGFGFTAKPGTAAAGTLIFGRNVATGVAVTIPLGTTIVLNGIQFTTTAAGSIPISATESAPIAAQCGQIGIDGNIAINAISTLAGQGSFISQPAGCDYCYNPVIFTGGTEIESEADRMARFNLFVASLARAQVTGLMSGALTVTGIIAATVVENTPTLGWNTVYADDGTGTLTPTKKAAIEKVLNGDPLDRVNYPGYRAAGIQLLVLAPNVVNINFTVDIKLLTTSVADPAMVIAEATTALETYVNTLRLGMDVILTEIVKQVKEANSEIYDMSFSTPTTNTTISATQLARTGTVVVTSSYVTI